MISGRENYRRAIEFDSPEYLPTQIRIGYGWLQEKDEQKIARIRELEARFPNDRLDWMGIWKNATEPVVENGRKRWRDEWGTGWLTDGMGWKSEIHPLEASFDRLAGYAFPDPNLPGRFDDDDRKLLERGDRYTLPMVWFTLFERYWLLRGYEQALTDPYLEQKHFTALQVKILEIDLAMVDRWIERKVDGIFFSDDWGTQTGLVMRPDDWRRFYKPAYAKLFARVREGGAHVWFHSCGNITAIIPDLIELGVNVLNPVQPLAMDLEQLSRAYRGKLCFFGGLDVQQKMIHCSPDEIRAEVHRLVHLFGGEAGGYIGGPSQSIMPETPLDNIIALLETFLEYR
jgi:uroporphyrinogen decarboxylase